MVDIGFLLYEIRSLGFFSKHCGPNVIYWMLFGEVLLYKRLWFVANCGTLIFLGVICQSESEILCPFIGFIHRVKKEQQPHQPITWQFLPQGAVDRHAFKVRVLEK